MYSRNAAAEFHFTTYLAKGLVAWQSLSLKDNAKKLLIAAAQNDKAGLGVYIRIYMYTFKWCKTPYSR
jgi:hypothetical protein